jgi:hypothetical protein
VQRPLSETVQAGVGEVDADEDGHAPVDEAKAGAGEHAVGSGAEAGME